MSSLSVLLVIHNEEKQLKSCLNTINFANEIIIVLDKCNDNSREIAKKFTKNIFSGSWEIEGERRNFGLDKCNSEWILEIDADERVSSKLKYEILNVIKKSKFSWHMINVNNFLGNKIIQHGWGAYFGKSSYAGLFRKGCKIWGKQRVHPKIKMIGINGPRLTERLDHFYCKSVSDLFIKLNSYSSARAKDMDDSVLKESLVINIRRLFSRFWKCYILRKGYKEKKIGFVIALVASLYPILSYLKNTIELDD